jgi:hypothetical protein
VPSGVLNSGVLNSGVLNKAPETPRSRTGQLAADPGPLPFAIPPDTAAPTTAHRVVESSAVESSWDRGSTAESTGIASTSAGRRVVLWTLAVLLFLGAATAGFGVVRVAAGRPALPSLGTRAVTGTSRDDVVLTPRVLQVTEPDGTRPARVTVSVPQGWPEFREQRMLGNNSGTVLRFVSPDGSEVIAVERVTGGLPGGSVVAVEQYLTTYLRKLAQGLPQLVETQRQRMSADALDATFRTQEGGELRRTTYLRMVPARPDLWVVAVTVPTEREGAGRTKLFEPVVAAFAPGL